MSQTIEERVAQVVKDVLGVDLESNFLDVSIEAELAPTSLDQMTLFIALEDEFQKSIPPEEVENIDTVRDVISYIESKLISLG